MNSEPKTAAVKLGFEEISFRIPLTFIMPLRQVSDTVRKSVKYAQIAASIKEVGIIEPPVVTRDKDNPDMFHLLDGHLRLAILEEGGEEAAVCLVATDDEAFTYNKRVSRIAIVQEHRMILNAVKKGVSEERLARALNVNIGNIRAKRNLLVGICPEAADLLKDKHVPLAIFTELRFLQPIRQIEACQLMIAMNRFNASYAKSIVAATPAALMAEGKKRRPRGLTDEQIALMQTESAGLDREFRIVEQSYSADHLDLTLALGYVSRLLSNASVVRYLARHHGHLLAEFQKVTEPSIA